MRIKIRFIQGTPVNVPGVFILLDNYLKMFTNFEREGSERERARASESEQ